MTDAPAIPAGGLWDEVVGQERAVAFLRAAALAPVHAYLLVGPAGVGKRAAARSFAAALLCANGGCGTCRDCRLALTEVHPDLAVIEREGPSITVDQAREIVRQASLAPTEGRRQVLVLVDFHLVEQRAPILLKTIEEPPSRTVFVVLAEDVPPELVTIASRCVRVELGPLPPEVLERTLMSEGASSETAQAVAAAAGGQLARARLLVRDPGFATRRDTWRGVPGRLDGTGAAAAVVADELAALLAGAAVEALEARQAAELAALEAHIERYGERGSGRKALLERHKRERRRLRTDELRFGLATLQAAYRDPLLTASAGSQSVRAGLDAISLIGDAAKALEHNPNETLLLQALLVRLPALAGAVPYSTSAPE